jgi:hypothetical protein
VTAPFAVDLCGYRSGNENPSTSDNNDRLSVEWGRALFEELGVQPDAPEVAGVGSVMESKVAHHLASLRPDLVIANSRSAGDFEQYSHLKVFRDFSRAYETPSGDLIDRLADLRDATLDAGNRSLIEAALRASVTARENSALVAVLLEAMPEESLLKIDITVASPAPAGRLLIALSSKWSLRTDRAQDCISQGAKLVNQRRGQMPHYAVLTMEPRPAMLRLIASGSGAVDCVYHLALPELRRAAETIERRRGGGAWGPRHTLERLVAQRRVRDYDELLTEINSLPSMRSSAPDD